MLATLQVYGCATRRQLMTICRLERSAGHRLIRQLIDAGRIRAVRLQPTLGRASQEVLTLIDSTIEPDPLRLQMLDMALQRAAEGWQLKAQPPHTYLVGPSGRRLVIVARLNDDTDGADAVERIVESRATRIEYVDPDPVRARVVARRAHEGYGIEVSVADSFTAREEP